MHSGGILCGAGEGESIALRQTRCVVDEIGRWFRRQGKKKGEGGRSKRRQPEESVRVKVQAGAKGAGTKRDHRGREEGGERRNRTFKEDRPAGRVEENHGELHTREEPVGGFGCVGENVKRLRVTAAVADQLNSEGGEGLRGGLGDGNVSSNGHSRRSCEDSTCPSHHERRGVNSRRAKAIGEGQIFQGVVQGGSNERQGRGRARRQGRAGTIQEGHSCQASKNLASCSVVVYSSIVATGHVPQDHICHDKC